MKGTGDPDTRRASPVPWLGPRTHIALTRLRLAGLVLACAAVEPAAARAQPIVQWKAPDACPSSQQVRQQLLQAHRVDTQPPTDRPFHISGNVQRQGTGWQLRLRVVGQDGVERVPSLSADNCQTLTQAGIVAIALALADAQDRTSPTAAGPA